MIFLSEFKKFEEKLNSSTKNRKKLKNKIVLVKFGGSAANGSENVNSIFLDMCYLKWLGAIPLLVHGGGPVINKLLDLAGIKSEFINGQRKTDANTIQYVEMALKGRSNNKIVKQFNQLGYPSVGISGCDGFMVKAKKRQQVIESDGSIRKVDLGFVGDVEEIKTDLLELLISNGYIPVIAPLAFGEDNNTYNINADIFAGMLAAALNVHYYIVVTDVDGLRENIEDANSVISEITLSQLENKMKNSIAGGMIPKIESCITAVKNGVSEAYIVNGKKENIILESLLFGYTIRTKITK